MLNIVLNIIFAISLLIAFLGFYMIGYYQAQKEVCEHLLAACKKVGNTNTGEFVDDFWHRFETSKDPLERIVAKFKK